MTAKEKAIELVTIFLPYANQFHDNDTRDAKECALILVEEILSEFCFDDSGYSDRRFEFYLQVKQEIKKL